LTSWSSGFDAFYFNKTQGEETKTVARLEQSAAHQDRIMYISSIAEHIWRRGKAIAE
jgi:hypothetical protein